MTDAWRTTDVLTPTERLRVLDLLNRLEADLGREAIDEGRRRAVLHDRPAEHWLRADGERLDAYAHLAHEDVPSVEMAGGGFDGALSEVLLRRHRQLRWWSRGEGIPAGRVVRTLHLMRAHLPVAGAPLPEGAVLRPFDFSRDADAWLAQNNDAFADHPEQGAWTRAQLDERTHESWYDPSGFLVLELDGDLAASCWTKIHELHPERFGEIYVISVHPRHQRRGLGRLVTTRGLASLHERGVRDAILYVDADNAAALALYRSLGFSVERTDCVTQLP